MSESANAALACCSTSACNSAGICSEEKRGEEKLSRYSEEKCGGSSHAGIPKTPFITHQHHQHHHERAIPTACPTHPLVLLIALIADPADLDLKRLPVFVVNAVQAAAMRPSRNIETSRHQSKHRLKRTEHVRQPAEMELHYSHQGRVSTTGQTHGGSLGKASIPANK